MKKLFIDKSEGVAEIVEKVIGAEDAEVTLVVPKGAEMGRSLSSFNLLKREADTAGKSVTIESVDEGVLALAKSSELQAAHPLFSTLAKSSFSDIVPRGAGSDPAKRAAPRKRRTKAEAKPSAKPVSIPVEAEEVHEEPKEPEFFRGAVPAAEPEHAYDRHEEEAEVPGGIGGFFERVRARLPGRRFAVIFIVLVALAFGVWIMSGPFARATITINFEKTPWKYDGNFVADVSFANADLAKSILPAELFTVNKNLTHIAKASGFDEVAEKAKGKIWIYNAFNSSPQTLVATTRFETPDGKIFRIINQVKVPAAKVQDGKIIPSGIEADIVADKAGPDYNLGPIARLTIPGFKGSPRFDGFYGEIKEPTKGGFIGKKAVATAEDIKNARAKAEELLRGGLATTFTASYPKEFQILDGASKVEIVRMSVNQETDADGNFSVFGEAKMSAFGFREADLKAVLEAMAQKVKDGTTFRELKLDYANIKPDFERKTMGFALASEGVLWPKFSADALRSSMAGKSINEVQSSIAGLPGFAGGRVAVWPIWLRSVPSDVNKVEIVLE